MLPDLPEIKHTDYLYTSPATDLGHGNRTDVKNKYFDAMPGPGTYERPKGNMVDKEIRYVLLN